MAKKKFFAKLANAQLDCPNKCPLLRLSQQPSPLNYFVDGSLALVSLDETDMPSSMVLMIASFAFSAVLLTSSAAFVTASFADSLVESAACLTVSLALSTAESVIALVSSLALSLAILRKFTSSEEMPIASSEDL